MSTALSASSNLGKYFLPLISKNGKLRATAPKDGHAKYVWRLVAFYLSSDPKQHCMPTTADFGITNENIPADFFPEIPDDILAKKIARTNETQSDVNWCVQQSGSVEAYHKQFWKKYDRRTHYIKTVLDPIVDEIINSVPVSEQHGTRRWAKVFGVI